MILNGCILSSKSMSLFPTSSGSIYRFHHSPGCTSQRINNHCGASRNIFLGNHKASAALPLSSTSTSLLKGDSCNLTKWKLDLPKFPKTRPRSNMIPRAAKDVPTSYRYPPMTKKPKWWWRTLACIPYLMPLHETWMYSETAYHLHPFLEDLEFLCYPFLEFIGQLPTWFLLAYFFIGYLGVVRRKEWPHFFRFHVVTGMLLEISLQVVGTVSKWLPDAWYWGKLGMHFWTAISFAFMFTVLECIRCALAGMYADVPFYCDAAYIQIPYD